MISEQFDKVNKSFLTSMMMEGDSLGDNLIRSAGIDL